MERSALNKFQHQYWVTKQTVYRKLGKKEDECIVASDATLDAKLELFKSIQQTSSAMNKLLDRYQERICYLAQEQNSMGRFLKEYGKTDKSAAGKMMIQMGKSLIYTSQQEIGLRPPLLRLYQEVETFRFRAVEDTLDTIKQMERNRTEYRASLNWMKNVSQELDPDTYKQMEKFRKVQIHVKKSKGQFDKLKLACLQKVDLLAAARCNMFSHALIQYQNATMKTTEKNAEIFHTLASTFKGYQHFEFNIIKELVEPARKVAKDHGNQDPVSDELLFDLNEDGTVNTEKKRAASEGRQNPDEDLLAIGGGGDAAGNPGIARRSSGEVKQYSAEDLLFSENRLEDLLGPLDLSPETEQASEALDLGLAWPDSSKENGTSNSKSSKAGQKKDKDKEKSASDLLSEEFDIISVEENTDTMALLNELLIASGPMLTPQPASSTQNSLDHINSASDFAGMEAAASAAPISVPLQPTPSSASSNSGFLPSQLLDFGSIDASTDLLNFNAPALPLNTKGTKETPKNSPASWYDIFADLDPIANPDAVGKKEEGTESRYC